MRVFVETSAINWLADWPDDAERFFGFASVGRFVPVVAAEVALEVRKTRSEERLKKLEAILARFYPLSATYLPRSGTARSGLAIVTGSRPLETLMELRFLAGGWDRTHLVNAHRHRCDVFLTRDGEMRTEKVEEIKILLWAMRLVHPKVFVEELAGAGGGESDDPV